MTCYNSNIKYIIAYQTVYDISSHSKLSSGCTSDKLHSRMFENLSDLEIVKILYGVADRTFYQNETR